MCHMYERRRQARKNVSPCRANDHNDRRFIGHRTISMLADKHPSYLQDLAQPRKSGGNSTKVEAHANTTPPKTNCPFFIGFYCDTGETKTKNGNREGERSGVKKPNRRHPGLTT